MSPWRHSGAQRALNLRGIAAAKAALADARRRLATVSNTDGATVARVEFLARRPRDQLAPVALAPAGQAVPA